MKRPLSFVDYPEFKPNVTPEQMFELGVFGGAYWRPIYSSVVGKNLSNQHKKYKWNIPEYKLVGPKFDAKINHFGTLSGTTLEYWETHDWIRAQDPYGWVQWYCNFYNGRRTVDDRRQINRWLAFAGPNGRFRNYKNKSNRVKQGLLQWALLVD